MRKFATVELIGEPHIARGGSGLMKGAHRATFKYTPREGFLYVRSRMISSRCNDNFDEFPPEEIAKGYLTFVGKPVFVNHHNENHRRMRGVIREAVLHEDFNPDGSPDTWVEGLMEIDAKRFPKLAEAIIKKHIQRTSMGVDVAYSLCSACGNKASTPAEYCKHIPRTKGQTLWRVTASGRRKGDLIREICHGLRFFENSLLVEDPADPTAFFLGDVEVGPGLEHLSAMAKAASIPAQPDLQRAVHAPTPGPIPLQRAAARTGGLMLVQGSVCRACASVNTVADRRSGAHECIDCGNAWTPRSAAVVEAASRPKYPDPADHPWFQENPVHHSNILSHWDQATQDEKEQGRRWYSDAHLIAKALGDKYLMNHPQGSAHAAAGIVATYSPQMGWAGNLHNAGRVMHEGRGIGGPGAGMFASAQQAKAADRILSGENYNDVLKGPKVQDFAHLIEHGGDADPSNPKAVIDRHALSVATGKRMSDDDYSGFPKSNRHYYGHVVSQYHEAARQISDKEDTPTAAHHVQAATWLVRQRLNQADERDRHAAGEDTRLDRGREKARIKQEQGWQQFHQENLPHVPHSGPGTGYQASRRHGYGEIKAPSQVNTLRDEACPVCGETNSYDGSTCKVCGFVQPPEQFQDPDLEMARNMDLRQQDDGQIGGDGVSALEQQTNDQDGDGFDDKTGEPMNADDGELDEQPMLACSNCGAEFPAGEPMTTDTRDPQAGDMGSGPAEGDVCPECGKGELLDGDQLAAEEQGMQAAPEDGEQPDPEGQQDSEDGFPEDDSTDEQDDDDPDESDEDDEDKPPSKKKQNPFGN